MSQLAAYRKTIAALVGSIIGWGFTAQPGGIDGVEWWGLALAAATALGVYQAPNEPLDDGDEGQSVLGIVLAVLVIAVLLRILGLY